MSRAAQPWRAWWQAPQDRQGEGCLPKLRQQRREIAVASTVFSFLRAALRALPGLLFIAAFKGGLRGERHWFSVSNDAIIVPAEDHVMRTTVALDDDLLAKAQAFTGLKEKSALIREALTALIERESARRLARLGGSESRLATPPRRRPKPA